MAATKTTPKAPPAIDAAAATQTYRVVSPLEHDLVVYPVGAEIELTDAQAGPLLGHTVELDS